MCPALRLTQDQWTVNFEISLSLSSFPCLSPISCVPSGNLVTLQIAYISHLLRTCMSLEMWNPWLYVSRQHYGKSHSFLTSFLHKFEQCRSTHEIKRLPCSFIVWSTFLKSVPLLSPTEASLQPFVVRKAAGISPILESSCFGLQCTFPKFICWSPNP